MHRRMLTHEHATMQECAHTCTQATTKPSKTKARMQTSMWTRKHKHACTHALFLSRGTGTSEFRPASCDQHRCEGAAEGKRRYLMGVRGRHELPDPLPNTLSSGHRTLHGSVLSAPSTVKCCRCLSFAKLRKSPWPHLLRHDAWHQRSMELHRGERRQPGPTGRQRKLTNG